MTEVQSIAFYRGWTKKKAEKWLAKYGFEPIKPAHETANMIHYRIHEPTVGQGGRYKNFITKKIIGKRGDVLLTLGILQKKKRQIPTRPSGGQMELGYLNTVLPSGSRETVGGGTNSSDGESSKEEAYAREKEVLTSERIPAMGTIPVGSTSVYPLKKESGILTTGHVLSDSESKRLQHDKVTIQDSTSQQRENKSILKNESNGFPSGSLLGDLVKPKSEGGLGFPYPTSSSTFSPMDWLSLGRISFFSKHQQ